MSKWQNVLLSKCLGVKYCNIAILLISNIDGNIAGNVADNIVSNIADSAILNQVLPRANSAQFLKGRRVKVVFYIAL